MLNKKDYNIKINQTQKIQTKNPKQTKETKPTQIWILLEEIDLLDLTFLN